jgi:hypothetical protein
VRALAAVADDAQDAVMHSIWGAWPSLPASASSALIRVKIIKPSCRTDRGFPRQATLARTGADAAHRLVHSRAGDWYERTRARSWVIVVMISSSATSAVEMHVAAALVLPA